MRPLRCCPQDKAARKQQPQHAPTDPTQLHRTQPQVHAHAHAHGDQQQQQQQRPPQEVRYRVPKGVDLAGEEGSGVGVAAAAQGLAALPFLAEIYPVGGAGDRLGLVDEATGECLPAAMLPYAGRTLMEVLIRDLQVGVRGRGLGSGNKLNKLGAGPLGRTGNGFLAGGCKLQRDLQYLLRMLGFGAVG